VYWEVVSVDGIYVYVKSLYVVCRLCLFIFGSYGDLN